MRGRPDPSGPVSLCRPRLGTTVHRLGAVGLLYLLFSSVEGVLRVTGVRISPLSLANALLLLTIRSSVC